MRVGPYEVKYAKSVWLEEDRLSDPRILGRIVKNLTYISQGQVSGNSRCYAPLHDFHRFYLPDNLRLYVRIFEPEKVIAICALNSASDLKKDEQAGALLQVFISYLLSINAYSDKRFFPLPEQPDKSAVDETPAIEDDFSYAPTITSQTISDKELENLLKNRSRRYSPDPFIDHLVTQFYIHVERAGRVIVPAQWEGVEHNKADAMRVKRLAVEYFKRLGLNVKISYDPIALKYVLIPADDMKSYDLATAHLERISTN